jgi:hypothetical protein
MFKTSEATKLALADPAQNVNNLPHAVVKKLAKNMQKAGASMLVSMSVGGVNHG